MVMKMALLKSHFSYIFQFEGTKQAMRDQFEEAKGYIQLMTIADGICLQQGTSTLHFLIGSCIYSSVHSLNSFLVFAKVLQTLNIPLFEAFYSL